MMDELSFSSFKFVYLLLIHVFPFCNFVQPGLIMDLVGLENGQTQGGLYLFAFYLFIYLSILFSEGFCD